MTPKDAWLYAASWGSYVHNGDPGAVMYGFSEDCRPQSEKHRQAVIEYCQECRQSILENPDMYDDENELEVMDAFIGFIKERSVPGQEKESFIIEISSCGAVYACKMDGQEVDGELRKDLLDCTGSGDAEGPCRYVLDEYKPQFRTVKVIDGEYQNVLANAEDKYQVCKEIYGQGVQNLSEESIEIYLIWEAAHSAKREF